MDVESRVIAHGEQRYPTLGDFFPDEESGVMRFRVSRMGNEDYEFLILVHELIEAYLCKKRGITCEQIDDFDFEFRGDGEPGDEKNAPYYREHQFATAIERLLANELGVDWREYESAVSAL